MTVVRNPAQEQWEGFVAHLPHAPFLQSSAWGEFQSRVGRTAQRVLLVTDGQPVAGYQALTHTYPLGFHSLYLPAGPVFATAADHDSPALWEALTGALAETAAAARAVFTRIEPHQPLEVARHVPVRRVASVQPSATHRIDLSRDEAALLAAMHPKTRYNIRLAERQGVTVESGGDGFLDAFIGLLAQTEHRHGVRFFGPAHFRTLWQTEACRPLLTGYRALFGGQTVAAILVLAYGDTAVYLHGGSSHAARQHMAPHLLQWTAIRQARAQGFHWYDFRGVAPVDAPTTHPWAGFSRFKRSFGGVDAVYPGAYDWVRRPFFYSLYRAIQQMRRVTSSV